jgi:hypothetical protein
MRPTSRIRVRVSLVFAAIMLAAFAATASGANVVALFTIAGGSAQGFKGDGGPATSAQLNGPAGVLSMSDGSLLVADTINQRIRKIAPNGRISTIAGTGKLGFAGDGGPAKSANFQDPSALAIAPDGSLYVADTGNSRIRVVKPDGTVATAAGTADQGFSGDGGKAAAAQVNAPSGLAADKDGNVYFSDTGNNRVRVIHADGTINTVAGNGQRGPGGDGGPAKSAELNTPAGLAVQVDGALLIADAGNNKIRRVARDGTISTVAGNGGGGSAGDGSAATAAQLNLPIDVAAAPAGGFFIAEQTGNRIRYVGPTGKILRLAGTGAPRYGGDGEPSSVGFLNAPHAVELLPSGFELAIADSDNNRIRYIAIPGRATLFGIAALSDSVTAPLVKKVITVKKRKRGILAVKDVPIAFELTKPGKLVLKLFTKKGKPVTTLKKSLKAGRGIVHVPARLRSGKHRLTKDHYVVRVTATAGSSIATDSLELVVK